MAVLRGEGGRLVRELESEVVRIVGEEKLDEKLSKLESDSRSQAMEFERKRKEEQRTAHLHLTTALSLHRDLEKVGEVGALALQYSHLHNIK